MKSKNHFIKWSFYILLTISPLLAQETIEQRQKKAQQVKIYYNMANYAFENGNLVAARRALKSALHIDPSHAHSIALMRKINLGGTKVLLAKRKRMFNQVKLPKVELEEVTLREAIKVLASSIETQTEGKLIPNFVIQDKDKLLDNTPITLSLTNVPAGVVLDELMKATSASATYTKYTIDITPLKK